MDKPEAKPEVENPSTSPAAAGKERPRLSETFERIWGQALVAVSAAEEEAARALQRAAAVAGWSQDEVVRQVRVFTDRLASQRRDLERNVEDGVRRALGVLKLPRREQLQDFEARLARLSERLDALEHRK
jgi:hypothetical protein